jgi:hypothetical protein
MKINIHCLMMSVRVCVEYNKCRCKGNVICSECWTAEHTIIYQQQQARNKR